MGSPNPWPSFGGYVRASVTYGHSSAYVLRGLISEADADRIVLEGRMPRVLLVYLSEPGASPPIALAGHSIWAVHPLD